MSATNEPVLRWEHEDAQNDVKVIAVYEDLGIGPMVLFDGAGFLDPDQLGGFIESLQAAKLKLELLRADTPAPERKQSPEGGPA